MSSRNQYLCNATCKGSPFVPGVVYVVTPGPRECLTTFREVGRQSVLHYPRAWTDQLIQREILIKHENYVDGRIRPCYF